MVPVAWTWYWIVVKMFLKTLCLRLLFPNEMSASLSTRCCWVKVYAFGYQHTTAICRDHEVCIYRRLHWMQLQKNKSKRLTGFDKLVRYNVLGSVRPDWSTCAKLNTLPNWWLSYCDNCNSKVLSGQLGEGYISSCCLSSAKNTTIKFIHSNPHFIYMEHSCIIIIYLHIHWLIITHKTTCLHLAR